MNQKIYIGLVIFFVFFGLGTTAVIFISQKNSYQAKTQTVNDQISEKNTQLDQLNSEKDKNNYLPSDVVKNFMNELKNDSVEKAKLYVVKDKGEQNFGDWLNVRDMLTQVNTTEANYQVLENGDASVDYSGYVKDESNPIVRIFTLVKEEDAWRIADIKES